MTRVAALYDIHGNLPALEAVLADVTRAGVDAVVVGGDVVPGPMPGACLNRLATLPWPLHWLHGNGEHDVLAAAAGRDPARVPAAFLDAVRWSAAALGRWLETVRAWPDTVRLPLDHRGDVLFCHATPDDDSDLFTVRTDEAILRPVFENAGAAVVVCGHTHMPFDRTVAGVRVVNAGSVGLPFGDPRPCWALVGRDDIELRQVDYDRGAAAAAFRATSYPGVEAFVEHYVLNPPAAGGMLEAFARAELASRRPRS